MKNNKLFILGLLAGIVLVLCLGYTDDWTESTPTDSTVANQIDDYMRDLRVDVAERLETYIGGFNASDTNEGFYHLLFIENATSLSTPAANKYLLYGLLADGKCELVGEDEDGDMIQLSYTGKHMIGSGTAPQAFMYNTTEEDTDGGRKSTIRAKGEQSGGEVTTLGYIEISHDGTADDEKGRLRIMLNDGDDTDAPSKCPVEYISDGTIDVNNSVSVLDEDAMDTNSATQLATQQSIKAYIDTQIAAITTWVVDGNQVYNTTAPTSYTDLDLSSYVGSNLALVYLKIKNNGNVVTDFLFRTNGETLTIGQNDAITSSGGVSCASIAANSASISYIMVVTDTSGIVEWKASIAYDTDIWLVGYIK